MANLAALSTAWQPATKGITLYYNPASQPSRSVVQLLYESGVEFKTVSINLGKQEQKTPAFLSMNPAGHVPVIYDSELGKFMPESTDIMRHISKRFPSVASFYAALPAEKQAEIDETLEFSAKSVRSILTELTRAKLLSRKADIVAELTPKIPGMVDALEQRLAKYPSSTYFCGTEGPNIADLQLLHEINGGTDLGLMDPNDGKHPQLAKWYAAMTARPASIKAYGNLGWVFWGARKVLGVKSIFSSSGTL